MQPLEAAGASSFLFISGIERWYEGEKCHPEAQNESSVIHSEWAFLDGMLIPEPVRVDGGLPCVDSLNNEITTELRMELVLSELSKREMAM